MRFPDGAHRDIVKCGRCHGEYEFLQKLTVPPPGIHGEAELWQCNYCGNRALFNKTTKVSGPGWVERFLTWLFKAWLHKPFFGKK